MVTNSLNSPSMGNPQYTQFLRIIQREGTAQKQKKDSNKKESEEVKYEENEKSHGSVTQLSHGTCNERSSICRRSSNIYNHSTGNNTLV